MYTVAELLAAVKEMSPSELRKLSRAIQKEFSVTIEDPDKEEVYDFWQYHYMGGYTVMLNEQGPNRVDVIKALREYRGLSLKETRELIDHHLPTFVKENCEKAEEDTPAEAEEAEDYTHAVTADTVLYYEPSGGEYYHLDQNCKSVHPKYLPLQGTFLYSELGDKPYCDLKTCKVCGAP